MDRISIILKISVHSNSCQSKQFNPISSLLQRAENPGSPLRQYSAHRIRNKELTALPCCCVSSWLSSSMVRNRRAQLYKNFCPLGSQVRRSAHKLHLPVSFRYNSDMRINEEQYERIADYFPIQRGNVKTNNRDFINAIYTLTVCPTLGVHINLIFLV